MKKHLKDLNIIDNFLFNELMLQEDKEQAKEFARLVLEPIIKKKIGKLEIEGQKIIQGIDTGKRGIQMDAYIKVYENSAGEEMADVSISSIPIIYDLEPNKIVGSEEKRARLYHSIIDANITKSNSKYDELYDVYVILLLPYDPFGLSRMMYTIRQQCIEEPAMPYNDGATTIFLNAYGTKDIPSKKLSDMLKYLVDSSEDNAVNPELIKLHNMTKVIKDNSMIEVKYMQSWEEKEYYKQQGIKIGLEKGISQGISQGKLISLAETILEELITYGDVDEELKNTIKTEEDISILKSWCKLSMTVCSIDEFKTKMNKPS